MTERPETSAALRDQTRWRWNSFIIFDFFIFASIQSRQFITGLNIKRKIRKKKADCYHYDCFQTESQVKKLFESKFPSNFPVWVASCNLSVAVFTLLLLIILILVFDLESLGSFHGNPSIHSCSQEDET